MPGAEGWHILLIYPAGGVAVQGHRFVSYNICLYVYPLFALLGVLFFAIVTYI